MVQNFSVPGIVVLLGMCFVFHYVIYKIIK
jgi:hypothetical protein